MRLAVAALLLAGGGCDRQLNPAYCATHRDDPDCLSGGLVTLDAAAPECASDMDCTADPGRPVCDVAAQRCVECIDGVNESVCAATNEVCGTDQECHGCVRDGDCMASGVCLATQSCALEQNILYAIPAGTGTSCSRTAPCTLTGAVEQLSPQRFIIKLANVPGTDYTDAPVTFDQPFSVQLIGKGVTFRPNGVGDGITASGSSLEILGLAIRGATGAGVRCTAGALAVQEATIATSGAWGIDASDCNVRVMRSRISQNPEGAISLSGGEHLLRNNILDENGNTATLEQGNVRILGATGRFVFNTLVKNQSRNGGSRVGGVFCDDAAAEFVVAQNLLAEWGNSAALSDTCTLRTNYTTQTIADVKFVSDTDYHLTAATPAGTNAVRNDPSVVVDMDCSDDGGHIDDIDGETRPAENYCDRGADEYRP